MKKARRLVLVLLITFTVSLLTMDREMICLRLDRLPFWMGTIQPNRIQDEEKREMVIHYQREFADVAWAAFRREILPDDMLAEMDAALPPDQQQYHEIMNEAAAIRQELQTHDASLVEHGHHLSDLEKRVLAEVLI